MKRTGILLLTFLYAITVIGISLSVHYCGKRVSSVSIGINGKDCCCKSPKKHKCCSTKTISAKITDTHTPASQLKVSAPQFADVCFYYTGPLPAPKTTKTTAPIYYKNWHLPMGNPLFLRNRNILI